MHPVDGLKEGINLCLAIIAMIVVVRVLPKIANEHAGFAKLKNVAVAPRYDDLKVRFAWSGKR